MYLKFQLNDVCVFGVKEKGCVGAQSCTECIELNARTNFSCEWCTKTEKLVF